MKKSMALLALCALAGCVTPPPVLRSAPTPTSEEISQMRALQTRVIATPADTAVGRAIPILFDNGYIVRAADAQIGFISFSQQWNDATQGGANLSEEGSILFTAAGTQSTQVRVMLTGGWQRLEVTGGGPRSTDTGMVGGVQQAAGTDEYRKLLDLLQAGLTASKP